MQTWPSHVLWKQTFKPFLPSDNLSSPVSEAWVNGQNIQDNAGHEGQCAAVERGQGGLFSTAIVDRNNDF